MITAVPVKKSDGSIEIFEPEKLRRSLLRSGASKNEADEVVEEVESDMIPGSTTAKIYRHAFSLLNSKSRAGVAARYSLRRSLGELGPSGFPFERYVAEVLKSQGFEAETGVILQGGCVSHEVDVVAENENDFIVAEVKFHNQSRIKSDVKVALYIHSRFQDLLKTNFGGRNSQKKQSHSWLVTNTKFTTDAIHFGACAGLHLVGWSYPKEGSLREMIEGKGLEPLTALTTLTKEEKRFLMDQGIVLCRTIVEDKSLLRSIHISNERIAGIVHEAKGVAMSEQLA